MPGTARSAPRCAGPARPWSPHRTRPSRLGGVRGVEGNEQVLDAAIDLLDLDGNRFRLSEYRGKKVYMKFWASWCTVCLARLEEVEKLANDAGLDFEVVTVVSPGYGQELDLENFRKWFAKQEHNRFPVLIDEGGKLAKWYGVRGYPTSFFIDPEGAVKVFQGDLSGDMIHQVFASEMMNREPETEDD